MGRKAAEIIIGSALIAASFIPGAGTVTIPILATHLSTVLFAVGATLAARGLSQGRSIDQRVTATYAGEIAPIPVVYGEALVGGRMVDIRVDPDDEKNQFAVVAWCVGSEDGTGIEGLEAYWLDQTPDVDERFYDNTEHLVTPTGYAGSVDQQVDETLNVKYPEAWPLESQGRYIAYTVFFCKTRQGKLDTAPQSWLCLLKGRKVLDTRDDTWKWSQNPALCIRDFLLSKMVGWGEIIDSTMIDEQSFIDAANYCDEVVSIPGESTQTRFTCDVALNGSLGENLEALLSTCRGRIIFQGGKLRLSIRHPGNPVAFELTPDNIIRGTTTFSRRGARRVPNSVRFTYSAMTEIGSTNPNPQPSDGVWPRPGTVNEMLSADNGFVNELAVNLPGTHDKIRAEQLAMVACRETRADAGVELTATEAALVLQTDDIVLLTHDTPGWDQKPFWVDAVVPVAGDGTVRLVLSEYDEQAYELDPQFTGDLVPGTNLPNPFVCQPPTRVRLTSDESTALATQDGQFLPRIKIVWIPAAEPFLEKYETRYKLAADPDSLYTAGPEPLPTEEQMFLTPVTDGAVMHFEIRAKNQLGVRSEWVGADVTVSTKPGPENLAALYLTDWVEQQNTDGSITFKWKRAASVFRVWVYDLLYAVGAIPAEPWPSGEDLPATVLAVGTDEYTAEAPLPGFVRFLQFEPRGKGTAVGPVERRIMSPTTAPPDDILDIQMVLKHEDGSVEVRIDADPRAKSIRYAYTLGTPPAWPTDAAVEAGTLVLPTGGTVGFTLVADTVALGETIRLRAAAYTNVDGTGSNGATDHGVILGNEAERTKFRAPTLTSISTIEAKDTGIGTFTLQVNDPDHVSTALYYRKKAGDAAWGDWTLKSAAPEDATQYAETATLLEKHLSYIEFRLDYTIGGIPTHTTLASGGMDLGKIPNVIVIARIDEVAGTASATVIGDVDTACVKVDANVWPQLTPTLAEVRAKTAKEGNTVGPDVIGDLVTGLKPGDKVYFSALGYSTFNNGVAGGKESKLATDERFVGTAQPWLVATTTTEGSGIGTFGVTVVDPAGVATALYYRTKVGSSAWSSWTLKSAAPAWETEYQETVALVPDHPSYIEFRLDFTLTTGADNVKLLSQGFDYGKTPDVILIPAVDKDGNVTANIIGDADTLSCRVALSVSSFPDDATVRLADPIAGRVVATGTLQQLTDGQVAYLCALGYTNADGTGTESAVAAQARVAFGSATELQALIHPVSEVEATGSGTFAVRVDDPSGVATALEYRTRYDSEDWSVWATKSASPQNNTQYEQAVTLLEGHLAFVQFRLTSVLGSTSMYDEATSSGFDVGQVPDGSISLSIDATGAVSLVWQGDSDTASIKWAAFNSGWPTEAQVRAAGNSAGGRSDSVATGLTLSDRQTGYVCAFLYGPNSEESTSLLKAKITFDATAMPLCTVNVTEGSSSVTTTTSGSYLGSTSGVTVQWRASLAGSAVGGWTDEGAPPLSKTITRPVVGANQPDRYEFRAYHATSGKYSATIVVPIAPVTTKPGPSLKVWTDTPTAGQVTVHWAADSASTVVLTMKGCTATGHTDGETLATSGSIAFDRPAAGNVPGVVTITASKNSADSSDSVTIPPRTLRAPVVKVTIAQTAASTGRLTLTIADPDKVAGTVKYNTKSGSGAWGGLTDAAWDVSTGVCGTDTSLVRSKDVSLVSQHLSFIAWELAYNDGLASTIGSTETFDADTVANIRSLSISFSSSGQVLLDWSADEDTTAVYINVGDNSSPADPTHTTYNATSTSRTGNGFATGVTVADGHTAYVKIVGYNSGGEGPIVSGSKVYTAAPTQPNIISAFTIANGTLDASNHWHAKSTWSSSGATADHVTIEWHLVADGAEDLGTVYDSQTGQALTGSAVDWDSAWVYQKPGTIYRCYAICRLYNSGGTQLATAISNNLYPSLSAA